MATINTFTVKPQVEIRSDILRTIRLGLIARGVANPNVTPNSDFYIIAEGLANELAVVGANCVISADQVLPDTAIGADLERIAAVFGLSKQAAAGSVGYVVLDSTAATTVIAGTQLIDGSGLRYEVTIGGIYNDGDQIPVAAVDTGSATNIEAGETLRFTGTPPAYASDQALVDVGGLTNGIDAENDEDLRARLVAYLRNPPRSGNWQHVAELAEASTASVQKAFVYPAIQGPATFHVAAAAAPTATNRSRELAGATLTGVVVPAVQGGVPEHAYSVITTVDDVDCDVSYGLALPDASGGGWLDASPWPSVDGASTFRVTVTAVTSSTQFTVDATTAPTINVSRVCWLSPTTWKLYQATVTAVSGTSGAYVVTVDSAFTGIATGCYVWPAARGSQTYVDAALAAFAQLGPGEKTSNASALIRGYRRPTPGSSWSSKVAAQMLGALGDAGDEVAAATFYHRTDGTTTITGASGALTPQLPATIDDAPLIFVPRHLAFYPI